MAEGRPIEADLPDHAAVRAFVLGITTTAQIVQTASVAMAMGPPVASASYFVERTHGSVGWTSGAIRDTMRLMTRGAQRVGVDPQGMFGGLRYVDSSLTYGLGVSWGVAGTTWALRQLLLHNKQRLQRRNEGFGTEVESLVAAMRHISWQPLAGVEPTMVARVAEVLSMCFRVLVRALGWLKSGATWFGAAKKRTGISWLASSLVGNLWAIAPVSAGLVAMMLPEYREPVVWATMAVSAVQLISVALETFTVWDTRPAVSALELAALDPPPPQPPRSLVLAGLQYNERTFRYPPLVGGTHYPEGRDRPSGPHTDDSRIAEAARVAAEAHESNDPYQWSDGKKSVRAPSAITTTPSHTHM